MTPVSVLAAGALSALGRGAAAYSVGTAGEQAPAALRHQSGWPLKHPLVGAVDDAHIAGYEGDRAARLLVTAAADLARELDVVLPRWRAQRVGLVVGTSSGAMQSIERALQLRARQEAVPCELARSANYWLPLASLEAVLGLALPRERVAEVLGACVSSSLALGLACRWLEAERCELVIVGGYDALSSLVAAGFDALGATTRTRPRPFASERDGMAMGEGAALLALTRSQPGQRELGRILGFAATADATHVTAPDREARGLLRAARAALSDAGLDAAEVDFVSAHATATPYNDEAEARAIEQLFARDIVLHPWKAAIGHALGAGGALEALAAWDALRGGLLPATPGREASERCGRLELLARNEAARARVALKLSSAFGGANVALVLAAPERASRAAPRPARSVALACAGDWVRAAAPEAVLRWAPEAPVWRADSLSELVVAAIARLLDTRAASVPEASAIIVATRAATLELDERFDARRRSHGAVEPRRFPATSPNLCAGFAAICFGLRGPAFSVGGPDALASALAIARDLVALGDVPAAVVVAAEDSEQVVRDLFGAAGYPAPERGARAALLEPRSDGAASPAGASETLLGWVRALEASAGPI